MNPTHFKRMNPTMLKRQPQIVQLKNYYSDLTLEQTVMERGDFAKGEIVPSNADELFAAEMALYP